MDIGVTVGTDGVFANFDAANFGDFFGHFAAGQDAAFAGFCTLAKFYFNHSHLGVSCDGLEFFVAEMTLGVAHPVFGGADLKHDVAARFEVIG